MSEMSEGMEAALNAALRKARDDGATLVIELFEIFVDEGMCAQCCLREARKVLATKTTYQPPEAPTAH